MIPKIEALWAARDTLSFVALGITAATVAVILLLRRWRPRWPVLVIAVAAASLARGWFHLPVDTVASRFGALPSGRPEERRGRNGWFQNGRTRWRPDH